MIFVCIDRVQNVERTDMPSDTLWIAAFSISLVIHILFISAMLISRRYDMIQYTNFED